MFDYVCIFTTGGVLLWSKAFYATNFNIELINIFIKSMLLENTQSVKKQFSHQDYMLKWQIDQKLNVVFTVVYKEILQLAFVDQFIDMLSKAFIAGVYQKTLASDGSLSRDDIFLRLIANQDGMFGPHYQIVYEKWDTLVRQQQTAPKKMKTFAETSRGKKMKKGKKGGQTATTADDGGKQPAQAEKEDSVDENEGESSSPMKGEGELDSVMSARENLKKRFSRSKTQKSSSSQLIETPEEEKNDTPTNSRRNWVSISKTVNAKDLQKVCVNEEEGANKVNLEAEMEKYLGGDDEVLKGFYESDEEVQFDSINPDT